MRDSSSTETKELKARIKELESKLAKSEAAYRECENRYRTILNLSPDSIVIVNAEGLFTDVNNKFCEWTGFTRHELLQSSAMNAPFLASETIHKVIDVIKRRLSGEEVPPYEIPMITKGGNHIFAEVHATVLYDSLGVAVADMIILRDITGEKSEGHS